MKAQALWVVEPNKLEIRETEIPEPRYDEVQIKLVSCGVCGWDSYLYQGMSNPEPIPYMLGHEGVGTITKTGEGVTDLKPGDQVFCANAPSRLMAEYCTLPRVGVCKIPEPVTDWNAWIAEPTVCVVNLLYKTAIMPGDQVVLVGAGYMGLLTLMGLQAEPYGSLTVFEKRPERRSLALRYGAKEVLDPDSPEGEARVREIAAAGGANVVIDFAASDSGYALATRMLRTGAGKFVIGSWHRHEKSFDGTQWHLGGVNVLNLAPNSNAHFSELLPRTAAMIARGIYKPGELVTHSVNFREADALFLKSISKEDGYIKGAITF